MYTKSKTDTEDANRANERIDKELPTCTKSTTDIEYIEPVRTRPNTDTDEPMRTNDRNANELPMCMKSTIDIFREPEMPDAQPNTEIEEPTRTK
jgi:hypothetical protein